MLRRTTLILWLDAPMMNKFAFEAVDRTLRDITNKPDIPVGLITFVVCGDFRQVLPAVLKGLRPDIVAASIKESYLWSRVQVCRLRQNMRAANAERPADLGNLTFANSILVLGDDKMEKIDNDHVRCPTSMVIRNHTLDRLIIVVYGTIVVIAQTQGRSTLAAGLFLPPAMTMLLKSTRRCSTGFRGRFMNT